MVLVEKECLLIITFGTFSEDFIAFDYMKLKYRILKKYQDEKLIIKSMVLGFSRLNFVEI